MASSAAPVCTNCEIHAEAVFRVEGMDCNEEVVILERRLRPLAGMEALSAGADFYALLARTVLGRPQSSRRPLLSTPSGKPGCACGSSTRGPAPRAQMFESVFGSL